MSMDPDSGIGSAYRATWTGRALPSALLIAAIAVLGGGALQGEWFGGISLSNGLWWLPVAGLLSLTALAIFARRRLRYSSDRPKKGEPEMLRIALIKKYGDSPDARVTINGRWWENLRVARRQWKSDRNWYYTCRLIIVGGGVILPVLVSFQAASPANSWLVAFSIAVSLLIALSGGILELAKSDDRFLLRMLQHHKLEKSAWNLLSASDHEKTEKFETFEKEIEEAVDSYRDGVVHFLREAKRSKVSDSQDDEG